jgi:hypothetical protein
VVHGDAGDVGSVQNALSAWLEWMGFLSSGAQSRIGRYIGYFEPYATSHQSLDQDLCVMEETRNVARCIANAIEALRAGKLLAPDREVGPPRQK